MKVTLPINRKYPSRMSSTKQALSTPLLEVKHISKQFPGVKALHRVSLTLNQGELLAVIGENGAGKSTLMKTSISQPISFWAANPVVGA